jgi:uncharacterized protein with HEPN domain
MKDDSIYIEQIQDSISKIERFVSGIDENTFRSDEKTQSAVILQLALIGELAKRLSTETKERIQLPWKEIAGFRDRAIHDYFDIDLGIVWQTILDDIPLVKSALEAKDT